MVWVTANKNCNGPFKHTHKEMWPVKKKYFKSLPSTEVDRAPVEGKEEYPESKHQLNFEEYSIKT